MRERINQTITLQNSCLMLGGIVTKPKLKQKFQNVEIVKINDPLTNVSINSDSGQYRIDQIKARLNAFATQPEFAQVEVYDMWEDLPETNQ